MFFELRRTIETKNASGFATRGWSELLPWLRLWFGDGWAKSGDPALGRGVFFYIYIVLKARSIRESHGRGKVSLRVAYRCVPPSDGGTWSIQTPCRSETSARQCWTVGWCWHVLAVVNLIQPRRPPRSGRRARPAFLLDGGDSETGRLCARERVV